MPKDYEVRVGRKNSNPTLTPHRAKSVSYEMFKLEMDAKNKAYVFILSNNLLDKFRVFCRNYKSSNPHQDAINYLYYNLNQ